MCFLVDWNSLDSVSRVLSWLQTILVVLSVLASIVGIFVLALEVQKDKLADAKQNSRQQHHDNEIARLSIETAQANERAAKANLEQDKLRSKIASTDQKQSTMEQHHREQISRLHLETAEANERAVNANLEHGKLKAKVVWRTLTPAMVEKLSKVIHNSKHSIMIANIVGDSESESFAALLVAIFRSAGWQTYTGGETYSGVVTGVFVAGPANPANALVEQAFRMAEISIDTTPLPPRIMAFGGAGKNLVEVNIVVGSKPPIH